MSQCAAALVPTFSPVTGNVISNMSQCATAHHLSCRDSMIEMKVCLLESSKHSPIRYHIFSVLSGTAQNNEERTGYVITQVIVCKPQLD
jgi:hypothetical protein